MDAFFSMIGKHHPEPLPPLPPLPPHHNHTHADIHEHISGFGHSVLTIVTISFIITFFLFLGKTFSLKAAERANAYTSLFIVGIAGLAYYAMTTGLGVTELHHSPHHYRQLFYARYIDWIFTTPLLLLELVLVSGVDLGTTLWIIFADVAMIVTGLLGAVAEGPSKWGWFIAGVLFLVFVAVGLWNSRAVAARRSSEIGSLYSSLTIYLLVLWWAYPIVWAISEGKAIITSDTEVLLYGILDVLAKIVFAAWIFVKHDTVASANTGVASRLDAPLLGNTPEEAI